MTETKKNPLARFFTRYRLVTLIVFILVSVVGVLQFRARAQGIFCLYHRFLFGFNFPSKTFIHAGPDHRNFLCFINFSFSSSVGPDQDHQARIHWNIHPIPLNNLLTPGSGLEVLPEEALQVLSLIEANEVESYQISPLLNDDYHIMQRIVESAWPVRMKENSPHVFIRVEELPDFSSCQLVDQKELIALVFCD